MQFDVRPPDADGIIHIAVFGDADLTVGHQARASTVALVQKHGAKRILVDFRETRIVSPLHDFLQYYSDTAKHYPLGTRLALVIGPKTVPDAPADMELARVASLSGGIALRDFRNMDEAREWLLRP